jgi:hypothetical protein
MDTKDWMGFEAVFAPGASIDYAPEMVESSEFPASGVSNVVALVRRLVEHAVSIHHGHMAEIEITSPSTGYAIFAMDDLARDDTRFVIDNPQLLNGATFVRDATGGTPYFQECCNYATLMNQSPFSFHAWLLRLC